MPRPLDERQSLEQELTEIPSQIARYRQELADMPTLPEFKARRERLDWHIREREKRLVEVRKRLAALNKAARSGGFPDA